MSVYVYPTDEKWFQFLRVRSPLDEVNFWQPGGGRPFDRLQSGEMFFFRLKSPINRIAGGGIFSYGTVFPLNAAWEAFGEKNGVRNYENFRTLIEQYRGRMGLETRDDSPIGCIVLQYPFFLSESEWIATPPDYSLSLVQGKRFKDGERTTTSLTEWSAHVLRMSGGALVADASALQTSIGGAVYGEPGLAKRRLGQGMFRLLVSDAYERKCAVTGEKTLPVLEAAHIRPISRGGEHRVDNGLLLRSDLHKLFDLGYVTVKPAGTLLVSDKLRETWMNGRVYYELAGKSIQRPARELFRPAAQLLEWHNDVVFRK